jgi:pimeloyl-ACP methyl ester carboxylesterase
MAALSGHADVIERGDLNELTTLLQDGLPDDLAPIPEVRGLMAERAARQLANPGVVRALRGLPSTHPVRDRATLGRVTARCLVISQEDDEVHPASVGREIAALIPDCELHVFPRPYAMLRERDRLRDLVAGLLNGDR